MRVASPEALVRMQWLPEFHRGNFVGKRAPTFRCSRQDKFV